MTNPKAALTWIAIISLALDKGAPIWAGPLVVVVCVLNSVFGHLGYAILFSSPPMVRAYRRARRWIDATLGCFFSFASYKLATSET